MTENTFNDVLLEPQYSEVLSRSTVDLTSDMGKFKLRLPVMSANMKDITGPKMALAIAKHGGLGILHRFKDDPVIPKFEFLKVLAIGKTEDIMVFTQALDSLINSTSDPEIAERSSAILAYIMDTDKEVKTETEKIEAEEIYQFDSTGVFSFGLFFTGALDINQLKFEFINLNLDLYPNSTFDVIDVELADDVTALLVRQYTEMGEAWDYYEQVLRNESIFGVIGETDYRLFIISEGNINVLSEDKGANKYWLFFQKHYNRNEGD